jgi:DNA (cytosine-5)-methyltransferase 1
MTRPRPTIISLYAGAGGLDSGFVEAGFEIVAAVESDRWAADSYRANIGTHVVEGELPGAASSLVGKVDVVIGGPPCQGFSVIGKMDPNDMRSDHVHAYMELVARFYPRAFVMENVKALAVSRRWAPVRRDLVERARAIGYETELLLLNASDFGVPQTRERMFLVGIRGMAPLCPVPTSKGSPPSVRDALRGLPPYGAAGNDAICAARVVPAPRPVLRPRAHHGSLLFNGSGRPLDLDGPAKTLPASMGGNATPIIDQDELVHDAEPWVRHYHAHLRAGGDPVEVAPSRLRRITVQEAAALQTFDPSWRFFGPQVAQFRQIGNAVPPRLAKAVALSVRESLDWLDRGFEENRVEGSPVLARA